MFKRLVGGILLATLALTPAWADDPARSKVTVVFDHVLPNVPGKSMKGVLVEYGPGASSPAHTHPASAFIYATVLEGAIRGQVNNGPVTVYHAGFGPSLLSAAALPYLASSKGSIVNVSSTLGQKQTPGLSHYAASKAALDHLTRCWALELAPQGVRVNAVAAGPTETGALTGMMGLSPE
jgi:NAD(P)-dependent dehydrogenase (short-subunit alcohol dehydrogenase family)